MTLAADGVTDPIELREWALEILSADWLHLAHCRPAALNS